MSRLSFTSAGLRVALLIATVLIAGCNMFGKSHDLIWEWPAGRPVQQKLLVKVGKVEKASTGFLGIGASPSMADSLPDAMDATVQVIGGDAALMGQTLRIRLPGLEAKKLTQATTAAFGLLQGKTCVCVASLPQGVSEPEAWLKQWTCP
jgi:hypothetical protein